MSQTFATLRDEVGATCVAWVEISGIPYALSDGFITNANKGTLFTDAYTTTLTFYGGLEALAESESRSIELLTGKGARGGFTVKLTDFVVEGAGAHGGGFLTRLFGSERSDIGRTTLAVNVGKHVGGAGHDWEVDSAVALGSMPRDVYCGLETVQPQTEADPLLEDVVRSRWLSPCISHKANDIGIFPEVTDWPTVWRGRIVSMYVTFAAAGELAGGAAAARSSAHVIRGVLESVSWSGEGWTLECSSLDKLLDREACKGLARARLSTLIPAPAGHFAWPADARNDFTETPALVVIQHDPAAFDFHTFFLYVTAGTPYSVEEWIHAINAALRDGGLVDEETGGAFMGQLTLSLTPTELRLDYRTAAAGADLRITEVQFQAQAAIEDGEHIGNFPWGAWQSVLESTNMVQLAEEPAVNTNYTVTVMRLDRPALLSQGGGFQIAIAPVQGETSVAAMGTAVGDRDMVCVRSSSGVSLFDVLAFDSTNGILTLHFAEDPAMRQVIEHVSSEDEPIIVQRVCYLSSSADLLDNSSPLVHGLLRLLLSTGESGYNHADYDTLPEGVGIEWPHETPSASADSNNTLIDVSSFERAFADAAQYAERIRDVFIDPFRIRDYIERRLGFFGFYLVVENGQIKARQGTSVLPHQQDGTLTDKSVGEVSVAFGRSAGIRGIRYKTGFKDFETVLTRTYLLGHLSDQDLAILEHEDPGVITDDERLLRLSQNALVEFSKEGWRFRVEADRAAMDIEPGMVVAFSDEGASDTSSFFRGVPNPDGTRGHNGSRMLVLAAESDYEDSWTWRGDLYMSKIKRGGYSASAWIVSHAGAPSVLTCSANVFSPDADGVDASRFSVGDKVRVAAVNPLTTENGEQTFTIASINGNAITLSGAIDTAGANAHFASGEPLVLQHNKYETASQTATAQQWCHVGDSTGDIDDGGDACFVW